MEFYGKSRRLSSRSIKPRRFDDELVESSLSRTPGLVLPTTSAIASKANRSRNNSLTFAPEPVVHNMGGPIDGVSKKRSKAVGKRGRRHKHGQPSATRDIGRWKPTDDLTLIQAVQQTNDLVAVHRGAKFSCKFTQAEVQERWYALLFDPTVSRLAKQGMHLLPDEVIAGVQAKALFSKDEEELLVTIRPASQMSLELFQNLLDEHPSVFHPGRTARSLMQHWQAMKQFQLLPDQTVQPLPRGDTVFNISDPVQSFSDAEELTNSAEMGDILDEAAEHEMTLADRAAKKEIRQLENELTKWQVLVDSVKGVDNPDFDSQTVAILKGRIVRYLMRSKEITLGRSTKDQSVDVDLSLEGPAGKISRRQGIIRLRANRDFLIANEGKRPIYVDGKPVLNGNKCKLHNNSVIEMSCLKFVFLIHQDLIRQESSKSSVT